jgi:2-polyprenyl-3-methyl-5-hydroxy-6-metoxy-1,4-benzoquinol methylase
MVEVSKFRPCIVCGETEKINVYCQQDGFVYAHCTQCDLIYLKEFGTQREMKDAYTGGYIKSLRRKLTGPLRKLDRLKGFSTLQQRGRQIYQFAKDKLGVKNKAKLLDIGCNKGFILSSAAHDGCEVYGIDLVEEVTIPFKNTFPQFSKNIYSKKFCEVGRDFADNTFDIITAIDVVEHFEDPVSDLKQIHRILSNDGVVIIQTPDTACPEAHEQLCDWGALKPLEHLHLFNSNNFTRLCKDTGFTTVDIYQPFEYADGNFVAVLKK